MKRYFSWLFLCLLATKGHSQSLDIALAAKQEVAPSVSFQKVYELGKNKKFQVGGE